MTKIKSLKTLSVMDSGKFIPWLMRANSIVFIILSIICWANIMGISQPHLQFDNISDEGKAVAVFSCFLRPIVALGMWGMYRWGWAVWVFAVLFDYLMYVTLASEFGSNSLLLFYHFLFFMVICMHYLYEIYRQKFQNPAA